MLLPFPLYAIKDIVYGEKLLPIATSNLNILYDF